MAFSCHRRLSDSELGQTLLSEVLLEAGKAALKAGSAAQGMGRKAGKGPGFIGSCLAALCFVRLPPHLTDADSSPT